jgi:hypothetical protein
MIGMGAGEVNAVAYLPLEKEVQANEGLGVRARPAKKGLDKLSYILYVLY